MGETKTIGPDGKPIRQYDATIADILSEVEKHGREISLTKLQIALQTPAREHYYKFVDWRVMKTVVAGMVASGLLIKVPQMEGFYRYDIPNRKK